MPSDDFDVVTFKALSYIMACARADSLITSQIDTAPKHLRAVAASLVSLITSQIDTAPKQ